MSISNVLEPVYLILIREEGRAETVHWGIAPAFVVEAALSIEVFKVLGISFTTPKVQIANLEITPDCYIVRIGVDHQQKHVQWQRL